MALNECPGSPRFSYTRLAKTCERTLQCLWSERVAFVAALWNTGCPYDTKMTVLDIQVEPWPGERSTGGATTIVLHAKITATYSDQAVPEGLTEKWERIENYRSEHLVIPKQKLVWALAAGETINKETGKSMVRVSPLDEITLIRHECERVPRSLFETLRCTINETTFLGYAPYTVIFIGAGAKSTSRPTNEAGTTTTLADCTLQFQHRGYDWRKSWREDKGVYSFVHVAGKPTQYVYETADLSRLIRDFNYRR